MLMVIIRLGFFLMLFFFFWACDARAQMCYEFSRGTEDIYMHVTA